MNSGTAWLQCGEFTHVSCVFIKKYSEVQKKNQINNHHLNHDISSDHTESSQSITVQNCEYNMVYLNCQEEEESYICNMVAKVCAGILKTNGQIGYNCDMCKNAHIYLKKHCYRAERFAYYSSKTTAIVHTAPVWSHLFNQTTVFTLLKP